MPSASLSVLVIDENQVRASIIEQGLREAGYDRVAVSVAYLQSRNLRSNRGH